jgi:Fur family ferric uptake transcriptional regulator
MSKFKEDAIEWLHRNRLIATRGRVAIIEVLQSNMVPLTLKDIHAKVKKSGSDFATVFRFISLMEKKRLVERVAWVDGSTRHEIRSGDHHHHYLICRQCQKVEPVDQCVVKKLENQIVTERGYTAVDHSLQLSGICPSCQDAKVVAGRRRK